MSVTRSYSTRSVSSSRSISSSSGSGMQMLGAGQSLLSLGSMQSRAPSVYGGAGGYGTRVSESVFASSGSAGFAADSAVLGNEKVTMQNLNDRLASYLEKVRSLESANKKLELQIREFYDKKGVCVTRDHSGYFATIQDLEEQIKRKRVANQSIILQIDNAQLAAEDFKMKYECELNLHMNVEADVARLRSVRDSLTLAISDLEMQVQGLKEELAYMKINHEEEMRLARAQQGGSVNVEVDSAESVDLTKVLEEMREQYESVMAKNKLELEKWFKAKVDSLQTTIITCTTEVKTSNTELTELKRTLQSLEISRSSLLAEIQCLQQSLEEVRARYSGHLSQLQITINMLETELQQLRVSLEQQQAEYSLLLDLKMRLEMEIAEYRRLLEGEHYQEKKVVVVQKVVEEHKPHIERRVKTIVEEIIDGKVVSSSVDTQVEDIQ